MRTRTSRSARILTGIVAAAALGAFPGAPSAAWAAAAHQSGHDGSIAGQTITYWASNQAATIEGDYRDLQPQLDKFKVQTGVTVKLQVIGWTELQNKVLAATTSGQGPDVLNIGNSWAPSLQATGAFVPFDAAAFAAIGGKSKFVATALATGGAPGQAPTSVPLYSLAYGLYYNKAMFAARHLAPPATWQELVSDAKQLTHPSKGVYGMAIEGGSYTENVHFAFILGRQQGGQLFKGDTPTFTSPGVVAGIQQYVDLMGQDKVVNPSDAEYAEGTEADTAFAKGEAAMVMSQNNADVAIEEAGMPHSAFGVVPIPAPRPLPVGGKDIASFPAGINISIFKSSKHQAADEAFVKFMTSAPEQEVLDKDFTALPVDRAAKATWTDDASEARAFARILAAKSAPLPLTRYEADMETAVGNAMTPLIARAATGGRVTAGDIKSALERAQGEMPTS